MLWCGEGPRILPYLGFYQAPLWSQKSSKCPLFETFRPPLYRRMAGSSTAPHRQEVNYQLGAKLRVFSTVRARSLSHSQWRGAIGVRQGWRQPVG